MLRPLRICSTSAQPASWASDAEEIQGVLTAIAPIVGTARVVSASGKMMKALGIAIEAAEYEAELEDEAAS